jgi:hypothetical protein
MQEYFDLKAEGFDPFFVFTPLSGAEYEEYKSLVTLLDNTIIALGLALRNPKSLSDMGDYFRYLLMRRAIRSLRTIREMYNSRYDDDCLSIARTIYEAYLRMKFLRLDPGASERFAAMLAHEVGAYQTKKKKNGRPNYDVCVDPETGEEYKITITNREILDISDFPMEEQLYYELYPLLSGYVHPELVEDALRSMIAKDASVESEGDPVRAIILILTISVLFLLEVARSPFLRVRTRRDVHHVVKQIQKGLLTLITSASMLKQMTVPLSVYELFGVDLEFPHANRDPAPAA